MFPFVNPTLRHDHRHRTLLAEAHTQRILRNRDSDTALTRRCVREEPIEVRFTRTRLASVL